ncbi:MAG: thioredoxin family protein [Bacteroidetes bacterium]|nr:thioredoxin family protein [Bacteroidota bacterium]
MSSVLHQDILKQAINFDDYLALTESIVAGQSDKAIYKDEKMLRYTRSNLERMKLVLNKMNLSQKLYNALSSLPSHQTWVVITEPWCGDASWGTTALHVMATASDKISYKILLRDSFPELIKHYHTNGTESIPKLICLDEENNELWIWGPRPKALQQLIDNYKKDADFDFRESVRKVHAWYEADMSASIQEEILQKIKP